MARKTTTGIGRRRGRPAEQSVNSAALRRLRTNRGWTQVELAKKAGVDRRTISRAEQGARITTECLQRIAQALEVSEDEFLPSASDQIERRLRERGLAALAPPRSWVERPVEVEQAKGCLVAELPRTCCLAGPSGMGKTALARFLARALRTSFPDGVIWVDATRVGSADVVLDIQLRIADALEFLSRLGSPEQVGPAAFTGRFVDELWKRRCLLILDDLLIADALYSFAPAGGQVPILVTSQLLHVTRRFDDVILLGGIRLEDTRHILVHHLGKERTADDAGVGKLHAVLAGVPRSIHIAATVLERETLVTLNEYAERIRREPNEGEMPLTLRSPATSLQASFAQIQPHVSSAAWQLLGALSLFNEVPFSLDWAIAASGGLPNHTIRRLLSELIDVYLVAQDAEPVHQNGENEPRDAPATSIEVSLRFRLESHVPLFARTILGERHHLALGNLAEHAMRVARRASEHNAWYEIRTEQVLWSQLMDTLLQSAFTEPHLLRKWDGSAPVPDEVNEPAAAYLLAVTMELVPYFENEPVPTAEMWLRGSLACARTRDSRLETGRLLLALGRYWLRAHVDLHQPIIWFDAATEEFLVAGANSLASAAASEAGRVLFGCERPLEGFARFERALAQARITPGRGTELACRINSAAVSFTRGPDESNALPGWERAAMLLDEAVQACIEDDFDGRFFRVVCTCNLVTVSIVLAHHGHPVPIGATRARQALDEAITEWRALDVDAPIFEARLLALQTLVSPTQNPHTMTDIIALWHSSLREDRRAPQDLLWQIGEAAFYLRLYLDFRSAPEHGMSPVIAQSLALSDISREIPLRNNQLVPVGFLFPVPPLEAVFTPAFIAQAKKLSIAIYGEQNRVLDELQRVEAHRASDGTQK